MFLEFNKEGYISFQGYYYLGNRFGKGVSYNKNGSIHFVGSFNDQIYGECQYYNKNKRIESKF